MKRIKLILAVIALFALAGSLWVACGGDTGEGGGSSSNDDTVLGFGGNKKVPSGGGGGVTQPDNPGLDKISDNTIALAQPKAGYAIDVTTSILEAQYKGSVIWYVAVKEEDLEANAQVETRKTFNQNVYYKAVITLTGTTRTLKGIPSGFFSIDETGYDASGPTPTATHPDFTSNSGKVTVLFTKNGPFAERGIDGTVIPDPVTGEQLFTITTRDGHGGLILGKEPSDFFFTDDDITPAIAGLVARNLSMKEDGIFVYKVPAMIYTVGTLSTSLPDDGTPLTANTRFKASIDGKVTIDFNSTVGTVTAKATLSSGTPFSSPEWSWNGTTRPVSGSLATAETDFGLGKPITAKVTGADNYVISSDYPVQKPITVFKIEEVRHVMAKDNGTGTPGTSGSYNAYGTPGGVVSITFSGGDTASTGTVVARGTGVSKGVGGTVGTGPRSFTFGTDLPSPSDGFITIEVTWHSDDATE